MPASLTRSVSWPSGPRSRCSRAGGQQLDLDGILAGPAGPNGTSGAGGAGGRRRWRWPRGSDARSAWRIEPRTIPKFRDATTRRRYDPAATSALTFPAEDPSRCLPALRPACAAPSSMPRSPPSPCWVSAARPSPPTRRCSTSTTGPTTSPDRHDQELREGNRHQGQLRQLRFERDPARQAGGGQHGLRHRRAGLPLRQAADRRRPAAEARPLEADELGQPRSDAAQAAGQRRSGQSVPRRLALGLRDGGNQRAEGEGGARARCRCPTTPGA